MSLVAKVSCVIGLFRVFAATAALPVREAFNFDVFVGFWGVNRQITIRRLLAISVIAGLVLAPLARPAMAGPMSDASMSDASMSAMMEDMSASATADATMDDMPCCPSKAPTPIGCDKCVLMAVCMDKCFTGLSAALFCQAFVASVQRMPPQNDFRPDGLGHPPPEHPPRTLV
ncbi:hypothetical protein [Bradyrhizobium sp.]|uniref:hypothetical protein n=1 Tax=Bradyrhizobium sp. TaxID=376 RepID=UPI003C7456B7